VAVEDRTGECRTCDGPIYRQPNLLPDVPDKWFHRRVEDWLHHPHDPTPKQEQPTDDSDSPK
jgi:hypothetical protein